ncbi:DUF1641 domain-containing protein [Brucella pituitosa]|uniref:DUF1641 domain-containing protein n=1 Tax=Brucella pituitosa TaxID=571256 RepID=UPI003F4AD804
MNEAVKDNVAVADELAKAAILDPATERGLIELLEKVAPLLQARRFHNLVDLASLASDGVDMFDDAIIQKLMKAYEEGIGAAWTLGNAARYSAAQVSSSDAPPSLFGLLRLAGNEDVRRGLHFALTFLSVLGRQMKEDAA